MPEYEHITPQRLEKWLEADRVTLIDVREPAEFSAEHISGAVNIPLSSLNDSALKDLEDKDIVFQCASGNRSCRALDKVSGASHDAKLYNLEGGITAWKKAQMPTEKSGKKLLPLDRQVQVTLGGLILFFSLLGFFVHNAYFIVPAFIGAGLLNAGITGWCGMALLMAKMPWNRSA